MHNTCYLGQLIGVTMILSTPAFAGDRPLDTPDSHRKLHRGEVLTEVPEGIQRDLYNKAIQFVRKVYPDMDEEVLRDRCSRQFLQDRCVVRGMHSAMGPKVGFAGRPGVGLSFPAGDRVSLGTEEVPPDVRLEKLEKPLKLKEAEQLAIRVLTRLLANPRDVTRFKMINSGESRMDQLYYFDWREAKTEPFRKAGKTIRIMVQKNDGLIQCVRVTEALPDPKIRFEDIAKTAAGVTPGFKSKHLYLTQRHQAGMGRLVWRYAVPPKPQGWYTDVSMWDAMTGELLYSEVSKGGKPDKPYRNPAFYTELTEESKQRNVEELIKRRVAELQEQ